VVAELRVKPGVTSVNRLHRFGLGELPRHSVAHSADTLNTRAGIFMCDFVYAPDFEQLGQLARRVISLRHAPPAGGTDPATLRTLQVKLSS